MVNDDYITAHAPRYYCEVVGGAIDKEKRCDPLGFRRKTMIFERAYELSYYYDDLIGNSPYNPSSLGWQARTIEEYDELFDAIMEACRS